jgi:hypothetical protein
MDTDEPLRKILTKFANVDTPPEMEITKRLRDALKETDGNLGDRDSVIALLITAVAELEAEVRRPTAR